MHPQREDGPHYQTAWQAFTGLFDKDRKKKPTPNLYPYSDDELDKSGIPNPDDDELKDPPRW